MGLTKSTGPSHLVFCSADYLDYTLRSDLCKVLNGIFESVFIEISIDKKLAIIRQIQNQPSKSIPCFQGIFVKVKYEICRSNYRISF